MSLPLAVLEPQKVQLNLADHGTIYISMKTARELLAALRFVLEPGTRP